MTTKERAMRRQHQHGRRKEWHETEKHKTVRARLIRQVENASDARMDVDANTRSLKYVHHHELISRPLFSEWRHFIGWSLARSIPSKKTREYTRRGARSGRRYCCVDEERAERWPKKYFYPAAYGSCTPKALSRVIENVDDAARDSQRQKVPNDSDTHH